MNQIALDDNNNYILELLSSNCMCTYHYAYVRELIQNALDACLAREAMEYSWGADFLEIEEMERGEQSKRSSFVREVYVPKICIFLDDKLSALIISDNGIGMEEEDCRRYLSRRGDSIYKSEEFTSQRTSYEYKGVFGMGLRACMPVSRRITINTKKSTCFRTAWNNKDYSSVKPVNVTWNKGDYYYEVERGTRLEAGTSVTLELLSEEYERLTLDILQKIIEKYICKREVEITLIHNDDKRVLSVSDMVSLNNLKAIKGVRVIPVNDELLEGYLILYSSHYEKIVDRPKLYQQTLLISDKDSLHQLKPEWIKNMSFLLNIKKKFVHVTLSKEDIISDKKFNVIRMRIGQILMKEFERHTISARQYMADGREDFVSRFPAEMRFVGQNISVVVVIKGKEVQLPILRVVSGFAGRNIKICAMPKYLYYFVHKKFPSSCNKLFEQYDMIIFENNMHAFIQYLYGHLIMMQYRIDAMPGVSYLHMEYDVPKTGVQCNSVENMWDKLVNPSMSACCFVTNDSYDGFELSFNEGHPFIQKMQGKDVPEDAAEVWSIIIENIKRRIINRRTRWSGIFDFGGQIYCPWNQEILPSIQAIGCLEDGFLDSVNDYWNKHVSKVSLYKLGLEDFKFEKEDFINWWYKIS